MSYFGNWCVKTDPPITPCDKQLLGRGPIEDVTTHKQEYTWKCVDRPEMTNTEDMYKNLYLPCAGLSGNPHR